MRWLLLLLVLPAQSLWALETLRAPCNPDELQQFCRKLTSLRPTDSLLLSDGRRLPACAMLTPVQSHVMQSEDRLRAKKARLMQILEQHPAQVHPSQVDNFYTRGIQALVGPWPTYIPWPPSRLLTSENPYQDVTEAMVSSWGAAIPAARMAELRSLAGEIVAERKNLRADFAHLAVNDESMAQTEQAVGRLVSSHLDRIFEDSLSPAQLARRRLINSTITIDHSGVLIRNSRACAPAKASFLSDNRSLIMDPRMHFYPIENQILVMGHEQAHGHNLCREHLPIYHDPSVPLRERYRQPDDGVRPSGYQVFVPGVSSSAFALRGIYTCLARPAQGGFAPPPEGNCLRYVGDETYCDYLAARVLGRTLESGSPLPRVNRPGLVSTQEFNRVFESDGDVGALFSERMNNGGGIVAPAFAVDASLNAVLSFVEEACRPDASEAHDSSHPSTARRYFDVLLREPAIARAANCPVTGPRCEIESTRTSPPSTTSGGALQR